MGLDQYLYVEKHVSRKNYDKKVGDGYDFANNEAFDEIISILNAENAIDKDEWTGLTVKIPVGYWRKANAIHGWVVNNCGGGVDECQEITISRIHAEALVDICKIVLADNSKAQDLLPPTQGFFFGGYDIDEYYLDDLRRTISIFEKALSDKTIDYLTYRASW